MPLPFQLPRREKRASGFASQAASRSEPSLELRDRLIHPILQYESSHLHSPAFTALTIGQREQIAHRLQSFEPARSLNETVPFHHQATRPMVADTCYRSMTHHQINGVSFSTPSNYVNLQFIEQGTYGLVWQVTTITTFIFLVIYIAS